MIHPAFSFNFAGVTEAVPICRIDERHSKVLHGLTVWVEAALSRFSGAFLTLRIGTMGEVGTMTTLWEIELGSDGLAAGSTRFVPETPIAIDGTTYLAAQFTGSLGAVGNVVLIPELELRGTRR